MFAEHILTASPQSAILHNTSTQSTQRTPEPSYHQLTVPSSAKLHLHTTITNPGRPKAKRTLNLGSPSTPYKKRLKL